MLLSGSCWPVGSQVPRLQPALFESLFPNRHLRYCKLCLARIALLFGGNQACLQLWGGRVYLGQGTHEGRHVAAPGVFWVKLACVRTGLRQPGAVQVAGRAGSSSGGSRGSEDCRVRGYSRWPPAEEAAPPFPEAAPATPMGPAPEAVPQYLGGTGSFDHAGLPQLTLPSKLWLGAPSLDILQTGRTRGRRRRKVEGKAAGSRLWPSPRPLAAAGSFPFSRTAGWAESRAWAGGALRWPLESIQCFPLWLSFACPLSLPTLPWTGLLSGGGRSSPAVLGVEWSEFPRGPPPLTQIRSLSPPSAGENRIQ